MTQEELQLRLAKSLKSAIKKYLKDGGKVPHVKVQDVCSVFGSEEGEEWRLAMVYGSVEAPGSIFIEPF